LVTAKFWIITQRALVIYYYSATTEMRLFLKLLILVKRSTYFGRSFCQSSGAQNCTFHFVPASSR